jgi:hypothetical protein
VGNRADADKFVSDARAAAGGAIDKDVDHSENRPESDPPMALILLFR